MTSSSFRAHLRSPGDPRIAGIAEFDAYSFADATMRNERARALFDVWLERYRSSDFTGITSDGHCIPGLYSLSAEGAPAEAMCAAATRVLALTTPAQRASLCHPLDAREWRAWMNPEVYLHRFGLRLDEIEMSMRDAILDVLEASLSPEGFDRARTLMRINHFLGELVDAPHVMNEFSYNFNFFGEPSTSEPWGWNFYGHHLCLNCLVLDEQMVLTPVFMGAEPNCIDAGPHAGASVFTQEESLGLALMRGLPVPLQHQARLYARKRDPAMPAGRVAIGDELHLAGAFRDNRVIPYEGACVAAFSPELRGLLMALVGVYLAYVPAGARAARMAQVQQHLDDTHFCWIGGLGDDDPFYYRIQSPVLIIEFDHHAGVFLGNTEPEKFHVHTIVRTPNGNDYGMELVRLHCEQAHTLKGSCCG